MNDPSPNVVYQLTSESSKPFLTYQIDRFREKLTDKNKQITNLLQNMLSFNPYFRMTAFECLKHKIFDQVRDAKKEEIIQEIRNSKEKLGNDSPYFIKL